MKCPKCGFNSFDHLSACKKCSADLTDCRERLGIRSVVVPPFPQQTAPAPAIATATGSAEEPDELFSWDIANDAATAPEPLPIEPVAADTASATGGDDFSLDFDDLPDSTSTPEPASPSSPGTGPVGEESTSSWQPAPAKTGDDMASFAGMLESIDRETPVPEKPDEFSFDDLEGFEKVDIFAEDAEQKVIPAEHTPADPDDFDALFSDEEKPDS